MTSLVDKVGLGLTIEDPNSQPPKEASLPADSSEREQMPRPGGPGASFPGFGSGQLTPHSPALSAQDENEKDNFLAHLASPKVKPSRHLPMAPVTLSLDTLPDGAGEESSEGIGSDSDKDLSRSSSPIEGEAEVAGSPTKTAGLSRKFMSMTDMSSMIPEGDPSGAVVGSPSKASFLGSLKAKEDATGPPATIDTCQSPTTPHSPSLISPTGALEHTVGTVKGGLKRSQSQLNIEVAEEEDPLPRRPSAPKEARKGDQLLVVFDMDRTMVGDLVSLSDRDNIETNVEWTWWPEGRHRGLSAEEIQPYLERGMVRPGLFKFVEYLMEIGATVVVYTHSEYKWASKVCAAMESMAGFKFVHKLFSRQDCRDGHPEFAARKSLQFVAEQLHSDSAMSWVSVEKMIMFDDDGNAVGAGDQVRLIRVPTYDYWEPCQWDEVVTPELLEKQNDEELVDLVQRSVVEWGCAPPSFGTPEDEQTEEDKKEDAKWAENLKKKRALQMSYNKVAKLDRVWHTVKECLVKVVELDEEEMETLPARIRRALGNNARPMRRFG